MDLGASPIGQGKTRIDRPGPKRTTGLCSAEAGASLQVVLFFREDEALQPSFVPIASKRRGYTALGWLSLCWLFGDQTLRMTPMVHTDLVRTVAQLAEDEFSVAIYCLLWPAVGES